ncbi:Phage major capsid protein, HK97 [Bacillus cereus 95/8201]|nr:phage prohead protease, HK97 family [Bacillus cereus]AJK35779.1 phage prohead protease, HK97 family [Bacillus cereus]EEL18166.1 Phage major capsid protein, HK97 [Bacillus cereus 95/8201]KWU54620.1 major capsid protein [Bacillus cereus]
MRGLVNPTGEWSQKLYDKHGNPFIERVMPSVFENALKRGNDVKLLLEHDNNMLLARTKDETLKLTETSRGLEMEANLVPSNQSEHIHALIKRGTLNKMSFGMVVLDDEWEQVDGVNKRSITELALYECSIVSDPAYEDSSVEARSKNIVEDVEVPNLTERTYKNMKFETMTSKQLEERKQELLSEANEIEESKATEKRSFTPSEQLRQEAILNEIRTINEQIDLKNKTQRNGEIIMNHNQLTKEEETRALEQFIRKQDGEELRATTNPLTTNGAPGSLTIPTQISKMIVELLSEEAPLFARTKNFTPVNGMLEILRERDLGIGGFVGEMKDLPYSDFELDKVTLSQKRVGSAIELSQQLVNDSGIDIVNYSMGILARRLGSTVDNSILMGNNTTEFQGIIPEPTIEGITSASSTDFTIDELLDLYNSMHPRYIKGAVFVVSRQAFNKIAKLKNDKNGEYYLVRDVATTGPSYTLFGRPVLVQDNMPSVAAGKRAVLFINFSEGYATMTKKGLNLQHISGDTKQALRGSHLLVLDGYMDGKILNQAAIRVLTMKSA